MLNASSKNTLIHLLEVLVVFPVVIIGRGAGAA